MEIAHARGTVVRGSNSVERLRRPALWPLKRVAALKRWTDLFHESGRLLAGCSDRDGDGAAHTFPLVPEVELTRELVGDGLPQEA